jgi:hypothetical protein
LIMRCTPTIHELIVLTLPPRHPCPLDRLPASRLLLPRSGLERSDFVQWPISDLPTTMVNVCVRGQSGKYMLALSSSQFNPHVWSGRALQEVFVDLVVSGLASMYPVSSWSCFAPDHHGYQRACVLINGQASTGPCGSPVFACAGKTVPPSLLIPLADLGWKRLIGLRHRLLLISPSSFVRA